LAMRRRAERKRKRERGERNLRCFHLILPEV
jgi:hypothetical protein